MKRIHPSLILLLVCGAMTGSTACGQSPLLNHDSAGGIKLPQIRLNQGDKGECPLSFQRAQLCAALVWTKAPAEDTTGTFELTFWAAGRDKSYVDPSSTVAVKLWMPAMGHGSSPVTVAHKKDATSGAELPGQFEATNIFFVMPGEWEIHLQLKNGSNVVDEVVIPIKI